MFLRHFDSKHMETAKHFPDQPPDQGSLQRIRSDSTKNLFLALFQTFSKRKRVGGFDTYQRLLSSFIVLEHFYA